MVRLMIKYYKYQTIPTDPQKEFNYLDMVEFMQYYFCGETSEDKRIESHLTVKMVEGKLVPKNELTDSEEEEEQE
ncbi:hypothetical protein DLAC_03211 [Tieghemostelium lacteum]|uniref:Uncharacterized protein n=1 Tax=Tieghemostelium lacteum TaxID=361077 RepID=A0A152A1U9_TIELA|nr:hypothetical protein DLAC_03211 [Tieghemostelium lacteum]|eukprot:KYR00065.1 hypothetical protein DLAC_03211 [Tieghemostelium lacteum]